MFAVTVAFGMQSWRLLYKTQEKAEAHFELITAPIDKTMTFGVPPNVNVTDDFGQRAHFQLPVIGVMLENLDESKLGAIEMALHHARTQAGAQQRAAGDQTLRAAQRNQQSPAIIDPMMNGRPFS